MIRFSIFLERLLLSEVWVTASASARILWVTMFLTADKHGMIDSSLPGLARLAVLELQEVADSLPVLVGLNLIRQVPTGWELIDPQQYSMSVQQRDAVNQARYRARKKSK